MPDIPSRITYPDDYTDTEIDPWKAITRKAGKLPSELESSQITTNDPQINAVGKELDNSLHDVASEVLTRHGYPADDESISQMLYGFADTNTGFALGKALIDEGPTDMNLNQAHQAFDSYVKAFVTTPDDLLSDFNK